MFLGVKNPSDMSKKELDTRLRTMYDVANVENGYEYWLSKLLNLCLPIFEWSGLPESLPQREIEIQLLLYGHCNVIVKNKELVVVYGSLYGVDKYYQPTDFTYAQPILGSDNEHINYVNNCLIWNSSLQNNVYGLPIDGSLYTFIARYARQLADIESTINIYTVNTRKTDYPIAKNDKIKASLEKFFSRLKMGAHEIISDDTILDTFVDVPIPSSTRSSDNLISLLDCKDKILEQFFRDIGVKFRNPKKGNMVIEEVESDEQILVISLDDMLKCRQKGAELLNSKFNTNVSVKINPKYERARFGSFVDETERGYNDGKSN